MPKTSRIFSVDFFEFSTTKAWKFCLKKHISWIESYLCNLSNLRHEFSSSIRLPAQRWPTTSHCKKLAQGIDGTNPNAFRSYGSGKHLPWPMLFEVQSQHYFGTQQNIGSTIILGIQFFPNNAVEYFVSTTIITMKHACYWRFHWKGFIHQWRARKCECQPLLHYWTKRYL
jgi:hypothetical protein